MTCYVWISPLESGHIIRSRQMCSATVGKLISPQKKLKRPQTIVTNNIKSKEQTLNASPRVSPSPITPQLYLIISQKQAQVCHRA